MKIYVIIESKYPKGGFFMPTITVRKARKSDYNEYQKMSNNLQFQYLYTSREQDVAKGRDIIHEIGINLKLFEKSFRDDLKSFEKNLSRIFIIQNDGKISGYIQVFRRGNVLKICDMVICDFSLYNELKLLKIFNELLKTADGEVSKIWLVQTNRCYASTLKRIGFKEATRDCFSCLEKEIGR